jgi:hypothetical protein
MGGAKGVGHMQGTSSELCSGSHQQSGPRNHRNASLAPCIAAHAVGLNAGLLASR